MSLLHFPALFEALTDNKPFPWQTAVYERFAADNLPSTANIPTGLGKTCIIAVWLIALARHPNRVPRRLVYVVNRRTVVDQTTAEVERLRQALSKPELAEIRNMLASLCALPLPTHDAPPLAISTLRGQFADNSDWCADPSRPAVVVGTVDMIGSGLLFSRYTRGFKTRPLHAGFLAQDALLVHDEAHLEPSFQKLLESIVAAQKDAGDPRKLRIIELTATSRAAKENGVSPFTLTDADRENETVKKRINAVKRLSLVELGEGEKLDAKLVALAKEKSGERAVLVFTRSVETAVKVAAELDKGERKGKVATLTGTMRGKERDELVSKNPVFQRFLPGKDPVRNLEPATGTVYLVATSAGEVGVNISADDLVCDLSTYESMAQRFGRVNRFGVHDDTAITVVYAPDMQAKYDEGLAKAKIAPKDTAKKVKAYETKNKTTLSLLKTLELLRHLATLKNGVGDASPAVLDTLPAADRAAAFSPEPEQRVATGIQFDAWALTSIRQPIAARPLVAPYLHGEAEWQPSETHLAWREELDVLDTAELRAAYPPAELLEDFPLKPHELLRDTSERIFDRLVSILSKRQQNNEPLPDAWLVSEGGDVEIFPLSRLVSDQDAENDDTEEETEGGEGANASEAKKAETARKKRAIANLADATLILPESLGGIDEKGLLTPGAASAPEGKADVADIVAENAPDKRRRVWSDTRDVPAGFRLIRIIDKLLAKEDTDDSDDNPASERYWLWLEAKNTIGERRFTANTQPESLAAHTAAVVANTAAITAKLFSDASALAPDEPGLRHCLILAARLHDLGKNRAQWQRNIGNPRYDPCIPETILAKSAPGMRGRNVAEHYRHELGSINDAARDVELRSELAALNDVERDIVLHVVAAHHGRARPHFPAAEILDCGAHVAGHDATLAFATETPRRFARLQKRFGRWGLAWLESILRAADYAASAGLVAINPAAVDVSNRHTQTKDAGEQATVPTATLTVDPANPGHYFACCGLFELASHLMPDAAATPPVLAWFEQDADSREWRFHLGNTPPLAELLEKITAAEITAASEEVEAEDIDDEGDTEDDEESEEESAAPPLNIGAPFGFRLDWWNTAMTNTSALKVWAGSMKVLGIARSMSHTIAQSLKSCHSVDRILFETCAAYDPAKVARNKKKAEAAYSQALQKADGKQAEALKKAVAEKSGEKLEKEKAKIATKFEEDLLKAKLKRDSANFLKGAKKEPFYFDANRGPNAHSRDVGFAINDLKWETLAAPAVELLTLVGLQRATPAPVPNTPRNFDYCLWTSPLPISLLPAAVNGLLSDNSRDIFRFESWFRTGQRKHKAFLTARTVSSR